MKQAIKVVAVALAAGAFAWSFRSVDIARSVSLVTSVRGAFLFVLAPAFVAFALDACAWRAILRTLDHAVALPLIVRARIAVEAIALTVPGGALAAESLKPELLRDCGVPLRDGIATVAGRKVMVLAANALYVGIALALGWRWMPAVVAIALGAMAVVLALSALVLLFCGARLELGRFRRLQRWLDTPDARVRFLFPRLPWRAALAPLVGAWLLETVETWIALRVCGIDRPLAFAIAMEVSVSVLRNILAIAPAGLGIQEVGYAAWLGDPNAAAAFVMIKRSKDVTIALVGHALLFSRKRAKPQLAYR